jgi:hypothetical protein
MALIAQSRRGWGHGKGWGTQKPKLDDKCNYCHEKGHWVNKCKKCKADEKVKGSANLVVDTLRDLETQEVGCVFMVMNGAQHAESDMILDSVATSHMFHDVCHFMQYALVIGESVEVGDSCSLPIARGALCLKVIFLMVFRQSSFTESFISYGCRWT